MKHKKKTKGQATEVDVHVGKRLRVRRSLLSLSQEKLAEAIGLTFQQVQKYERGMNRISAGRLYQFSKILNVPVGYFFIGLNKVDDQAPIDTQTDDLHTPENLRIISLYHQVPEHQRRSAFLVLKSLAGQMDQENL
jgi:transcriptional regulator with XRE-family HTH domain